MLCVALRSHPPTHIPVLKAPKGERSSPFLRSLLRGLVGSFASSFIHSLVHSFYSSRLHASTWPLRVAPLGSGLTHPPRARPRPLPAPPPLWANRDRRAGRGRSQGGASLSHYPRRRPRLRKRAVGLLGSAGCWRLRGASCHAGPGPRQRRSAEDRALAAAGPR